MLYRLLKKVNHSSNTVFSLSSRSYQSGLQSSGFSDEHARPRDGSFPAKTGLLSVCLLAYPKGEGDIPRYCPVALYAGFLLTSKTIPLIATNVGRLGSVPVAQVSQSVQKKKKNNRDIRHTVAFGQLLRADGIVLGRIQLDGHLGREALGFFFVFDHFECFERECVCESVCESMCLCVCSSGGGWRG